MNLVGAAGAAFFAQATLRVYLQTHRPLGVAFFAEQMWVVAAYLIRRPARTVSRRWGDWLLAFGGTFGGVLFRPVGAHPQWGVTSGLALSGRRPGDLRGFVPHPRPFLRFCRRRPRARAKRPLCGRPPPHLRLLFPASVRIRAPEHLIAQRPRDGVCVKLQHRPCRRRGPSARDERGVPCLPQPCPVEVASRGLVGNAGDFCRPASWR